MVNEVSSQAQASGRGALKAIITLSKWRKVLSLRQIGDFWVSKEMRVRPRPTKIRKKNIEKHLTKNSFEVEKEPILFKKC